MNDGPDGRSELDSILAEFGGTSHEEAAPSPFVMDGTPPLPAAEPEAPTQEPDEKTHFWSSRDFAAAARPVRTPVSAAYEPEIPDEPPRRAGLITPLFALLSALILLWALFSIHPA